MTENPAISLFSAVLLVGAAQGIFLALAIGTSPRKLHFANSYLALLVVAFVLELLNRFVIDAGYVRFLPSIVSLNWALDTVFGPLVFLYVHSLTRLPSDPSSNLVLRHLALPIVSFVSAVGLWIPFSAADFLNTVNGSAPVPLEIAELGFALVGLVSMIVYLVRSVRLLRLHRRRIAENYSFAEKVDLRWLRNLLLLMAVLLGLYVPLTISGWFLEVFDKVYAIAMVTTVFTMGFLGIKQPALYVRRNEGTAEFISSPDLEPGRATEKYARSALSSSEVESIFAAIDDLMDREHLYRQADLSLPNLADRLKLPSHYVSQAINQGSGANFFDFINKRRIQYVTERLANPGDTRRINILELAMSAGFNSKSSFYTVFKNHTGQTPGQFQQQHALDAQ